MPRQGLDRARVVAEAGALADEQGLEAVSLAALAGRLGVKAPSLYKHVDGLDALRTELAIATIDDVAGRLAEAVAGRSGRDALDALGRAWVGYARAHPGRYALTVRAPDPDDAAHVAAAGRVIALLQAALRPYGFGGDDELHAVRVVRAALHGFCATEAAGGFRMPLDRDASLDLLLDVLATGMHEAADER